MWGIFIPPPALRLVPNAGLVSRFMDSNVAEDWSVEFSEIQQPPVSRHPDVPSTTLGSRASGTARIILFVLHPNALMEAFLLPLPWEGAK